jgi:hypothetical protein
MPSRSVNLDMCKLLTTITLYERKNIKSVANSVCGRGLIHKFKLIIVLNACYNLWFEAIFER